MTKSGDVEQWTEYSIGVAIIFLRIFTRTKLVGFKGWKGDDFLVIFALACSSTQIAMHEIMNKTGTIGGINAEAAAKLTPEQVATKQFGSKMNFISWIAYTSLMWSLKGCMLFLYYRLTTGLRESALVAWTGLVVGVTYISMILLIFFNCFPTWKNWTLFPNPGICTYNLPHFYVLGSLNILTDILLLCIPIPLIKRSCLPMRRKIGIFVILCGGVFIIIASILNNLFSLLYKFDALYGILNHNFVATVTGNATFVLNWGVREAFIGILVVNVPCIKPLFSSSVWLKTHRSRTGASGMGSGPQSGPRSKNQTNEESEDPSNGQDFYNFTRRRTQTQLARNTIGGSAIGRPGRPHFRYDSDDGTETWNDDDSIDDFRSDAVKLEEGLGSRGVLFVEQLSPRGTASSGSSRIKPKEVSPVVRV